MISVLQIVDGYSFGGIVKLMIELNNNINHDIKLDFLTATNIYEKWNNLNISRKTLKGKIIYNFRLFKYLKNNKYEIVHINSGAFFFTFQVAIICKLSKVKKIVVHSHNTPNINIIKRFLIKLLNPLYRKLIDAKLTCSKEAAKSLFTKTEDVIVLKNGIDIEKFKFNENIRNAYRKELSLENKIVYGHVGRFEKQKNHEFVIDLFYELQKEQNNAILLLIGKGQLEQHIKNKVHNLNIANKVIFLGFREDINLLLNCIDVFILPSIYEGLPVSIIEAQTSGLSVFVSNAISNEAKVNNNFNKISSFEIEKWTDLILNVKLKDRTNIYKDTIKAGYDIKDTCKKLEEIYKGI